MNTRMSNESRAQRAIKGLSLQMAIATLVVGCGGGGGYGDDDGGGNQAPPPPPPVVRDAQFTDDTISGLRFAVADAGEGSTNGIGRFQFVEGRKIDFLVGNATNRILIGSATPNATPTGVISFSLHDLSEVQGARGELYLANLGVAY